MAQKRGCVLSKKFFLCVLLMPFTLQAVNNALKCKRSGWLRTLQHVNPVCGQCGGEEVGTKEHLN